MRIIRQIKIRFALIGAQGEGIDNNGYVVVVSVASRQLVVGWASGEDGLASRKIK